MLGGFRDGYIQLERKDGRGEVDATDPWIPQVCRPARAPSPGTAPSAGGRRADNRTVADRAVDDECGAWATGTFARIAGGESVNQHHPSGVGGEGGGGVREFIENPLGESRAVGAREGSGVRGEPFVRSAGVEANVESGRCRLII